MILAKKSKREVNEQDAATLKFMQGKAVYMLKKKLVYALHGREIVES